MKRFLALALCLTTPVAAAPVQLELRLDAPEYRVYEGELPNVTLTIKNRSQQTQLVQEFSACPAFRVFNATTNQEIQFPPQTCVASTLGSMILPPNTSKQRSFVLPPTLKPGDYNVVLTVFTGQSPKPPNQPQTVQAALRIDRGPLVTELLLPEQVRQGQSLSLKVFFRNLGRSTVQGDLRLRSAGLIIRDERGRNVYSTGPEGKNFTQEARVDSIKPGGVHREIWTLNPKLAPGRYTALFWNGWGSAIRSFQVFP